MLALALSTVRSRRVSFGGALVAVTLGVALICATAVLMANALSSSGAGRFAAVDAVVKGDPTITVGRGDSASVVTVHPSPRLPGTIVREIEAVPGVRRAIGDVAFPATLLDLRGRPLTAVGADRTEAHGWSSAVLTPYVLTAGHPPASADELVVDSRLPVRLGQRVRVATPAGARVFQVSGIATSHTRGDRGQSALFFRDETAGRLARTPGQRNAIGVLAAPGVHLDALRSRLSRHLGPSVKVLDRGHAAEADAGDPRSAQREDLIAFLGTLGALAGVIAVFVVASTFAFTIAQRRRELALLSAIGATPRQVRRMVAGEALVLAVLGGLLGCLLGLPLASAIGDGLMRHGIAPQGLSASPKPIAVLTAFESGLVIAELAVLAAARQAARVRPVEALREAAIEPRGLGLVRSLAGLAALGGAVAMFVLFAGDSAHSFAGITALLFAIALALLSPLLLGVPAVWLSRPLRASATGLLGSTAMATHRRRVGAVAAPIVLVVALAGTYAISDATTRAATQDQTAKRVRAPFVLVAATGSGLPAETAKIARHVPGVKAAIGTLPTQVFINGPGLDNSGSAWDAAGIAPDAIGRTLDLGVQSGSLQALRGKTIAVSAALARRRDLQVGQFVHARLADTTTARLRVGAIYEHALGLGDILLPRQLARAHAGVELDDAVFVDGPASVRSRLAAVSDAVPTARVLTRARYLEAVRAGGQTSAWIIWLLIGLIAAFAGIAIVNTSVIATADRRDELALVRLIGATRAQARRMIGWEALLTTLVGVAAGVLVARLAVARIPQGQPGWHVVVPPALFGSIVAGAAALGLLGSVLPAQVALRGRPSAAPDRVA